MSKEITTKHETQSTHPIAALFNSLGITNPTRSDRFTINYVDDFLEVQIKRASGQTERAIKRVKGEGGFSQMTNFEPDMMSKNDRNGLIKKMYKRGETQASLAKTFGITQAMISKIVQTS